MAVEDLRASSTPFSLSFSGSGFLALYQVGVVQSLLELAPELLKSACKVYGSSAGSLIAAAVVCGVGLGKKPAASGPLGALWFHKARGAPPGCWRGGGAAGTLLALEGGIPERRGVASLGRRRGALLGGAS